MILNFAPKNLTLRDSQVKALKEVQRVWNDSDVIVIQLPTSFGKTLISKTIMDWQKRAAYLAPTNILVKQFTESYPRTPSILAKELYECKEPGYSYCEDRAESYQKQKKKFCDGCPYVKDNKRIMNRYRTQSASTSHMYIARKLYQPVVIIDEAHTLINLLQDWHSVNISYKKFKYPVHNGFINRDELKFWIENLKGVDDILTDVKRGQKGLKTLYDELMHDKGQYLIKEELNHNDRVLKLVPLDFRGLWNPIFNKAEKLVLMSATISEQDIALLGLANRRVSYITAESPIPKENRPCILVNEIGPLSYNNLKEKAPLICDIIRDILSHHKNEKGLIHVTYQLADIIKRTYKDRPGHERLIFHDKLNKAEKFNDFKRGEGESVLVASGMYEGVDLPYDAGRFQIICKVPWPNLNEPAIKVKMALDKGWYEWTALKDCLQAYGRICRSPEDYGVTYILDASFKRLLNNKALPAWFKLAYKEV